MGAGGAVLGVGLEFVLEVGDGAIFSAALEELERAVTVLATELGIGVGESIGDGFDLPERFVTAGGTNSAALDLALLEVLAFGCHDWTSESYMVRVVRAWGGHGCCEIPLRG